VPHPPAALGFDPFQPAQPLSGLSPSGQEQYLRGYLADLGAKVVVTEPNYFDRDYLSEFAAFFGASARAYPNICRRLHFFSDSRVDPALLLSALDGDAAAAAIIRDAYLGFVVLRPIATPFGRSVLKMYDSGAGRPPRCMEPARSYRPHLAGLELSVTGIAWQQQDTSVSACATVALWTMFQASAFDEHHAMPTTAEVTRLANEAALSRGRVFPSEGLNVYQLSRSIRAAGLEPMIADPHQDEGVFASIVASLVRSRFPVLVTGDIDDDGHAVCIVGFREAAVRAPTPRTVTSQDEHLEALYVHDDNLGPNVRFEIVAADATATPPTSLSIRTAPPTRAVTRVSVTASYAPFAVALAVAAVPDGVRVNVVTLHRVGARIAGIALDFLNQLLVQQGHPEVGFTFTTRFARSSEYLGDVLPPAVAPGAVGRARLNFVQNVPPTSLFVGIVRVGTPGNPFFDLVFDTSDSDRHARVWATVAFHKLAHSLVSAIASGGIDEFGTLVDAT
jgi:hypothetical protein